jgi:hypothetical protein
VLLSSLDLDEYFSEVPKAHVGLEDISVDLLICATMWQFAQLSMSDEYSVYVFIFYFVKKEDS